MILKASVQYNSFLNIKDVFSLEFLPVIFIMLIIIFADTMGTTITLASKANLLDGNGNFKDIKKVFLDSTFISRGHLH